MNKTRLLELAGMQLNEGKTFNSAEEMTAWIVNNLRSILDETTVEEVGDIFNDIGDLLQRIENSSVKRRR